MDYTGTLLEVKLSGSCSDCLTPSRKNDPGKSNTGQTAEWTTEYAVTQRCWTEKSRAMPVISTPLFRPLVALAPSN